MGGAVAVVGVGVVVATAHAEEHQRHAEQDGQGNQQLGQSHGLVCLRLGFTPFWLQKQMIAGIRLLPVLAMDAVRDVSEKLVVFTN